MERRNGCLLALLLACAVEASLVAGGIVLWIRHRDVGAEHPVPIVLEPGASTESAIDLDDERGTFFEVVVPERTVALRIELVSRETELQFQVARDGNEEDEWDSSRTTELGRADLTIGRFSDPP